MNGQSIFFNPSTVSVSSLYKPLFEEFIYTPGDMILRFYSISYGYEEPYTQIWMHLTYSLRVLHILTHTHVVSLFI